MTSRRLVYALLFSPAIVSLAQSQGRSDTTQIWSLTLAEFTKGGPVFLEAYQAMAGQFNQLGPRHSQTWLDSIARDPRVAGLCDTLGCTRSRPHEFDMVRLSAPKFIAADSAHLFVLRTLQWGAGRGCNTGEEASYDLVLVKTDGRWRIRSNRPGTQALYGDSLCAARRRDQ